ncbi:MAG: hypothetical protein J6J12_07230 [Oscillospiraceae bacterium]|nr:hypothetical protein [Oscillospiraceae bacterium]
MDILVKLSVPNFIYRFYKQASDHIADGSPEDIMSDALCAYAGFLSEDVAKQLQSAQDNEN